MDQIDRKRQIVNWVEATSWTYPLLNADNWPKPRQEPTDGRFNMRYLNRYHQVYSPLQIMTVWLAVHSRLLQAVIRSNHEQEYRSKRNLFASQTLLICGRYMVFLSSRLQKRTHGWSTLVTPFPVVIYGTFENERKHTREKLKKRGKHQEYFTRQVNCFLVSLRFASLLN